MRPPRNPFRLRAADRIYSDTTFLNLFGPQCLKLLERTQDTDDQVLVLRSAEGGGKTSLMRLFTPRALRMLHTMRTEEDQKELFARLTSLGAVSDRGVHCLGVLLSLATDYDAIASLEIDEGIRTRVFYALLNAHIVLAAVAGAAELVSAGDPNAVGDFTLSAQSVVAPPRYGLQLPASGSDLVTWATRVEASVSDAIDSFELTPESAVGHDSLFVLQLLQPDLFLWRGQPFVERIQIMLDDVHRLSADQRERLIRVCIEARSPNAVWIGQRAEALRDVELLSSGAETGRDVRSVVPLERFWRDTRKEYEKFVLEIASRRAAETASGTEVTSFSTHLPTSPVASNDRLLEVASLVETRVRKLAAQSALFNAWIDAREPDEGDPWKRALMWRTLEVLIEREKRKPQRRLFDEPVFTADELSPQDGSDVRNAAELFLAHEFGLPYYFGAQRLIALSSWNVQQFLAIAGNHFEEMLAAALMKKTADLPPIRQHQILLESSDAFWKELPQRIREGRAVRRLLEAVGDFAHDETYLPNAPYSPGVTGIAITMSDREILRNSLATRSAPNEYTLLARVLSLAVAHNLVETIVDAKGQGESLMILYLNRLACARYFLPLHYGGYRRKGLAELAGWVATGKPTKSRVERRLL